MIVFQWHAFFRIQMKIFSCTPKCRPDRFRLKRGLHSARRSAVLYGMLLAAGTPAASFRSTARAQQSDPAKPVVVQPGAPGKPSKTLSPSTRAKLPPRSQADAEFMRDMIMHHSQAVEMTALISSHTENKELRSLGARISGSQSDETKFMKRWLGARGEPVSMAMPGMRDLNMSHHDMSGHPMALMP